MCVHAHVCICMYMDILWCAYVYRYAFVHVCVACKDHTWIHVEFPATEIGDLASVSGDAMVVRFTGLGSGSDS